MSSCVGVSRPRPRTPVFVVSQCRASAELTPASGLPSSDVMSSLVTGARPGLSLFYKTIDLITPGFVALKRAVKIRSPIVCDNLKKLFLQID